MAHFAELDHDRKVMRVIVVNNQELFDENGKESEAKGIEFCKEHYGGKWIQTSYNATIRGKYAGIGDTYNEAEDIFITPQPHPSWTRMGSYWNAPVPYPADGKFYQWNETQLRWDAV